MRAPWTSVESAQTSTRRDIEMWSIVAAGLAAAAYGTRRHAASNLWLALAASPAAYRAITGTWPAPMLALVTRSDDTRKALAGGGGIRVHEATELAVPVAEVYAFWRQLENLPRFMRHLVRVSETAEGRSHWVARGPAGIDVGWDAELINDIPDQLIAWRSLPGSDIVTAGSVTFEPVRGGRQARVTVKLQYDPPGGRLGALVAQLFGREPSQTIREDLRRLKQLLEAGELPVATAPDGRTPR